MTAVVVYESMYGSTRAVAEAVAEGLREAHVRTEVVEVGALESRGGEVPAGTTLLVVGGPTHAFSMSRPATRAEATTYATGALVSTGHGIREWLDHVDLPDGVAFATFDTKVAKPPLPGSAARAAAKRLRARGCRALVRPHSFLVQGRTEGLHDGELEKARHWGKGLALAAGPRLRGAAS